MTHPYMMVVGVDGSTAGQRALDWAAGEAVKRGHSASVLAVTCWEFDPDGRPGSASIRLPDVAEAAQQILNHAVAMVRVRHPQVAVSGEVLRGDAAHVLVHASTQADLLVLGGRGSSRMFQAVIGSVTEMCIRLSHCPVLVIPTPPSRSNRSEGPAPAVAA